MSHEQMRAALMNRYPGSDRIPKMPDRQVAAMYQRLLNDGKL